MMMGECIIPSVWLHSAMLCIGSMLLLSARICSGWICPAMVD